MRWVVLLALLAGCRQILGLHDLDQLDADLPPNGPSVAFEMASETVDEGAGAVAVTVVLSEPAPSPLGVALDTGGTAVEGTDYSLSDTIVAFDTGETSRTVTITVVDNTVRDPDKTVELFLASATGAVIGNPSQFTLTITDNDPLCLGPADNFQVCLAAPPSSSVSLPGSINTDDNSQCATAQPTGWTTSQGQEPACFVIGTTITLSGQTHVSGSRALVLVASDGILLQGQLNAASSRNNQQIGPGSPAKGCRPFGSSPTHTTVGGGGAGGSFMSAGGDGGSGDGGAALAGTAAVADTTNPTTLRAGCDGQDSGGATPGSFGPGGGAVYLVAGNTITLALSGRIDVSGGGAARAGISAGGAGGGAGGMIKLFAPSIMTTASSVLMANGGGGGGGGAVTQNGQAGNDPSNPTQPAQGGSSIGGDGGAGFAATIPAGTGQPDAIRAGGGGGGGGGYIESNVSLGSAQVSAGKTAAP